MLLFRAQALSHSRLGGAHTNSAPHVWGGLPRGRGNGAVSRAEPVSFPISGTPVPVVTSERWYRPPSSPDRFVVDHWTGHSAAPQPTVLTERLMV